MSPEGPLCECGEPETLGRVLAGDRQSLSRMSRQMSRPPREMAFCLKTSLLIIYYILKHWFCFLRMALYVVPPLLDRSFVDCN